MIFLPQMSSSETRLPLSSLTQEKEVAVAGLWLWRPLPGTCQNGEDTILSHLFQAQEPSPSSGFFRVSPQVSLPFLISFHCSQVDGLPFPLFYPEPNFFIPLLQLQFASCPSTYFILSSIFDSFQLILIGFCILIFLSSNDLAC